MLFTFAIVMVGIVLLTMVVNNRRQPSWWDRLPQRKSRSAGKGSWAFGGDSGGHFGADCSVDAGGCDGGGGGGD
jgi:hypothetical protein